MSIAPDTKDWTWVLREVCPECGYDAAAVDRTRAGAYLRQDAVGWAAVLALPDATERPEPGTWSPLEYACHVRDVHRTFGTRLALMLEQDEPTFPNWDQDETAVAERYDQQDPATVAAELAEAAASLAAAYDGLAGAPEATWARRGLRSNGSEFTVDTLLRYQLHDLVHHAWDVRAAAARATAAAYDGDAAGFAESTANPVDAVVAELDWLAGEVGSGTVLEIGSAGGRDALGLEEHGVAVRRTDVSAGFVERLRADGYAAERLDPLTDALGGPHDGVWANAALLHVARSDLPTVLTRLAEATRPGGALAASLKEGDGEAWSVHGRVTGPRRFTYWRAEPLRAALEASGWRVDSIGRRVGTGGQPWLTVRARRA